MILQSKPANKHVTIRGKKTQKHWHSVSRLSIVTSYDNRPDCFGVTE